MMRTWIGAGFLLLLLTACGQSDPDVVARIGLADVRHAWVDDRSGNVVVRAIGRSDEETMQLCARIQDVLGGTVEVWNEWLSGHMCFGGLQGET